MLKRFFILGLLILSFALVVAAQSGRRVRTTSTTTTPTQKPAQGVDSTVDSTPNTDAPPQGWDQYSESAPSSARSIYDAPRDDKRSKKDKKKEDSKTKDQSKDQSTETAKTGDGAAGDDEVLKIETNLISIPVSVYNRNGNYISGLTKENFKIFEDGKEEEVAYLNKAEKPFTVILLIDVSASTAYKIEEIQNAAIAFVDQLRPQDSVMVVQFDEGVNTLTDFTTDRNRIYQAIRKTRFGGGTSLYEAVDFSLRKRLKNVDGRKAIILFTDGVDTTSNSASYESNMRDAEESDAIVFPIYYNTFLNGIGIGGGNGPMTSTVGLPGGGLPGIGGGGATGSSSEEYRRGRIYLESIASVTGGRVYRPDYNPTGLSSAFEAIADELGSQYSIGYYPSEDGRKGQRKQIRVRVNRANVVVRARDSYIVGASN